MKSLMILLIVCVAGSAALAAEDVPTQADVSYGPDVRNVLDFW